MTDHDDDEAGTTGSSSDWRGRFSDVVDGAGKPYRLGQFVEDEQNAEVIRSYQPELIPGLLQLPATASAIADAYFPQRSGAERAQFVRARTERAGLLGRPDAPRFSVLVGEKALRKEWGSPEVRRAQLDALMEALDGSRPNAEVRIVPALGELPADTRQDAFVVMSLRGGGEVLWVEMAQSSERIEAEEDVKRALRSFEQLERVACAPAEARDLIKEIQGSLG
jgi:Domain of unknown function (DUF5753)